MAGTRHSLTFLRSMAKGPKLKSQKVLRTNFHVVIGAELISCYQNCKRSR